MHPRDYGTFPRALALARDEALLPVETVIRKMTSLPADRFGLTGRGRIEPGAFADLVLFDPATIRDTATYEHPHSFPEGLTAVVVNGALAWSARDGEIVRARARSASGVEPAVGFEPTTYRLQVGCATGLRHAGGSPESTPDGTTGRTPRRRRSRTR